MRAHVGAKLVAAKKRVAGKERIAFALEELVGRQPDDFVAVLLHPLREVGRFGGSFLVPKITRDKFLADSQPGIGGEDHVRKFRPGRDEMDVAAEAEQFRLEPAPLLLDKRGVGAPSTTHPRVNLVFDTVIIRRAEEQFSHTQFSPNDSRRCNRSTRAKTARCQSPNQPPGKFRGQSVSRRPRD